MSRIAPLFWHHGEPAARILEELFAVQSSGISEIVLEPRPHPDYLGPGWWDDVRVVIEAARERGMRVWFFDDARFPSGYLNGIVPSRHPELQKRYLAERHVDVTGPLRSGELNVAGWLEGDDALVGVVAAQRVGDDGLDAGTLTDLTPLLHEKSVYWDVPPGSWRIVVLVDTLRGGEADTAGYVNPIEEGAADLTLATIHEAHRREFADDFGTVIAGFFQDEPRFGNAASYEFQLGRRPESVAAEVASYVLPFSRLLWRHLRSGWGDDAVRMLPLLWFDAHPDVTARIRFSFMDLVTTLYRDYMLRLGDWCTEHGVALIGHLVEDNGAHARLGYGAGHYFRAIAGQHAGGIDVVHQIHPGDTEGRTSGFFGFYRNDFYAHGLARLASSAAHLDPRKRGEAICEAFGAYGWNEGLRLMKWLTDHLVVRGINVLVPHAFSPIEWDPDCPPHFYNGGLNPQWPLFSEWVRYAECLMTWHTGGVHHADAAVLYHAEAEWAGEAMPFEQVLGQLAVVQADADVVPIDAVMAGRVEESRLVAGSESYPLLIVPYAERLPPEFLTRLADFTDEGLPVMFVDRYPSGLSRDGSPEVLDRVRSVTRTVAREKIAQAVSAAVQVDRSAPDLRTYHYERNGAHQYLLVNESVREPLSRAVSFPDHNGAVVLVDLLRAVESVPRVTCEGGRVSVDVHLARAGSVIVSFTGSDRPTEPRRVEETTRILPTTGWTISARAYDETLFRLVDFDALGAVTVPGRLPGFAGTLRYELDLHEAGVDAIDLGEVGELARVELDGIEIGTAISWPYRFDLPSPHGHLVVEVTTTLAHAHGANRFDRQVILEPGGLLGPVTLLGARG